MGYMNFNIDYKEKSVSKITHIRLIEMNQCSYN